MDLIWRSEKIIKFGAGLIGNGAILRQLCQIFIRAKIYSNNVVTNLQTLPVTVT